MQIIALIDYGSGNIHSAAKAFEHVIADAGFDMKLIVTDKPEDVQAADRIILPGQGAFGDCISNLKSVDGMIDSLEEAVLQKAKPFFGICVGMQLLVNKGYEHGEHEGLGWIDGEVVAITPDDPSLKIPHMGWNDVSLTQTGARHPALQSLVQSSTESALHNDQNFYFVHSFMVNCKDTENILAQTGYGGPITAIIGRDTILGIQCHPEKSHRNGLALIRSFLSWTP